MMIIADLTLALREIQHTPKSERVEVERGRKKYATNLYGLSELFIHHHQPCFFVVLFLVCGVENAHSIYGENHLVNDTVTLLKAFLNNTLYIVYLSIG